MNHRIYLSPPHMSGREMRYVQDAFDTNWIAPVGPNIDAFEDELCRYTGSRHAVALSSGTAALHLALAVLNVKAGDVVLCQSLTFVATANPILYLGAAPVFVDSEPISWNICPVALEEALVYYQKIGKKPVAIIIVHLYGMPAMLDEILYLSQKYEVPLIEDAAEALGSEYRGRKAGTFGDMGIISFNGNKIITTSGGGAILTDHEHYAQRIRFLATQAREPVVHYEHRELGYNYRMSNVAAGIGRGQLEVIGERVQQRRVNFDLYKNYLGRIPGIGFQQEDEKTFSNRWLTAFVFEENGAAIQEIMQSLALNQIESRPVWKPMHLQPLYRDAGYFGGQNAEVIFNSGLCVPSGSCLKQSDIQLISEIILAVCQS